MGVLVTILVIFISLGFFLKPKAEDIYPNTFYPGSIHILKNTTGSYIELKTNYGTFRFPIKDKNAFFAISYKAKGVAILDVIKDGQVVYRRYLVIKDKYFRVSRIYVKKRKLTKKVLERIRKEYKLLRKIFKTYTPKKFTENHFIKPLKYLKISTPFGAKRIINDTKKSIHWGTDFKAPRGEPVFASLTGKVALARELYYTGNTVIIDHGLGLFTLYAHLSKISVKEGQIVKGGQIIGKVGSTGRSTGPHLHFGVYINDIKVDPMLALKLKL
ncbi:M23 family metallopeptidase [Persephonella sp. KM09-Lau-8]|uniref:M23 family metallopeptidase n=1 Tax=Persephonella sp. KM09-Lau-8 TaxID=1158345 RepID=UPI0009DE2095|nr:M23 family metallopeptidase [Persephonella sp. KM09-Lau-8]